MSNRRDRRIWIGFGLLCSFGVLTILVVSGWTDGFDADGSGHMADLETSWLVSASKVLHHLGSFPLAVSLTVLVGIALLALRSWQTAAVWVAVIVTAQVLSTTTKAAVDRARPIDALVHEASAAYPSGHAMVSGAAMGIGLAVLAGAVWPHRYRLFLAAGVAYAITMALSRVYLRAHWPTDVLGGLLFGAAIALMVTAAGDGWRDDRRRSGMPEER